MKKLFTTMLCLIITFCMVLAVGCSNDETAFSEIFNGNYVEVQASEVTAFNNSVSASEKALDINEGVKFEYYEDEVDGKEYEKESVIFKTVIDNGVLKMAGSTSEEEKDDGRETKENCEIYYDTDTLYFNDGIRKQSVKTDLTAHFNRAIARLNEFALDKVVAKYTNLNGVKFYKEVADGATKIKLEFEKIEDRDEITTGKILFVYNAENALVAINVEIIEQERGFGDNKYEKIIINVEPYSGAVELPSDLASYTLATRPAW